MYISVSTVCLLFVSYLDSAECFSLLHGISVLSNPDVYLGRAVGTERRQNVGVKHVEKTGWNVLRALEVSCRGGGSSLHGNGPAEW